MTAVYRDFDQETLDLEYRARATVPDITPFTDAYAERTAEMRARENALCDVPFGPHPDEVVDIYPAGENAPLFVFIHGGYWRMLSQKESGWMAATFNDRGAAVASINYSLAPGASLDEIVRQCRACLAFLHKNADDYGIDPNRIFVCGSSAGGHLTGMMVAGGWHAEFGVPEDLVKGCIPLSGIFDLEPIRLSEINEWAQLDAESAHRNSPIHHLPNVGGPMVISHGGNESSEFKRQSREYLEAWQAKGFPGKYLEMDHTNHFDLPLDLSDPNGKLTRAAFEMMGI